MTPAPLVTREMRPPLYLFSEKISQMFCPVLAGRMNWGSSDIRKTEREKRKIIVGTADNAKYEYIALPARPYTHTNELQGHQYGK